MPTIDRHSFGSFNWFELVTTDQAAAKEFYKQLFGWESVDSPIGPGELYTMFKLDGLDAGAAYTLQPEMAANGIPPRWDVYIAVESADETADQIESFGGTIIKKPFDVMTHGRMAVASDPTGSVFCIWQSVSHQGTQITGVDGTVCWADLSTPDQEAASLFYAGVFGWEFYKSPGDESGYLHIKSGGVPIGGIPKVDASMPPNWLLTFMTSDVEMATNRAGALGASTLFPLTDMPGTGKFSIVKDPQGAAFGLFQSAGR